MNAWVFTVTMVIPTFDFLMILSYNGSGDIPHLLIHGITAAIMLIISALLFAGIPRSATTS